MGVRVVFPDMGKDPSVQLIEKTITENGTYDAITDGANGYSKVNVNVEGGGGSSDFSTAEVTYPNGMPRNLPLLMILDDEIQAVPSSGSAPAGTYTFVLYKGKAFLHDFDADYLNQDGFSTSGNITYDSEGKRYVITGDFTVTAPQS